jgi:hypothetical protein
MFMVLPVPVSLSCNVKLEALAFLKMELLTALTVIPFNVNVPTVVDEFPIVKFLVRALVTSIAPNEREAVFMFIPAVVAVPVLAN